MKRILAHDVPANKIDPKGTAQPGELLLLRKSFIIPSGEIVERMAVTRDPRRVLVKWKGDLYVIWKLDWDDATPI